MHKTWLFWTSLQHQDGLNWKGFGRKSLYFIDLKRKSENKKTVCSYIWRPPLDIRWSNVVSSVINNISNSLFKFKLFD